jgi:hypothetical protein
LSATTLSAGEGGRTLSILQAGIAKDKEALREAARALLLHGAEVVVFGHTHQPDEWRPHTNEDGGYFNPGSWTRYVDVSGMHSLTLDDLRMRRRPECSVQIRNFSKNKVARNFSFKGEREVF